MKRSKANTIETRNQSLNEVKALIPQSLEKKLKQRKGQLTEGQLS